MSTIESLLLDSDDDDLGDMDLSAITLEDILREEELAAQTASGTAAAAAAGGDAANDGSTPDDDLFFSPATLTLSIAPVPGMEVVKAAGTNGTNSAARKLDRGKSLTEMSVGGNAAVATGAAASAASSATFRSPLEVAEAREQQLLSCVGVELISPLQVKRRLRASARAKSAGGRKKAAAAAKKKKTATGGAAASTTSEKKPAKSTGVVKVQAMDTISRQLRKNIEFKEFGPGSPTVVAIHSKFIAIGTSKGLVIIFDHFQNIRQVLGNTSDAETDGPITAIDVSPGSDYLVCGFQSGRIVLWDMIKGTSLKAVSDAHENPVVSLRFLKDQKAVLVSVDTNGVVNKLNFSKMMGMVYVVDVDPIYDGSAGKILSISVLPQSAGNAKISYLTDQYCLAALSSEKVTFIIAIEPEVKVLFRWVRPDDIAADDPVLPSLAFAWISFPGSSRALAPVLARGWGAHVQFLEAVFPGGSHHNHAKHGYPTFDEHDQLACATPIMATQWLDDQVVVYLTANDEICVYDVMSRQELEVVDVSSLELVFASYRGKNNARSFSNSFRGCDNILYLLGLKELQTARVQPWTQRIDTLVDEGEWLEALALALDHFEGLKVAAADRAARDRFPPVFFRDKQNDQCLVDMLHMCQTNQRTGEKEDVFRHEESAEEVRWVCGEEPYPPEIAKKLEETLQKARSGQVTKNFVPISVAERVADLLMEYVRLAIANAPASSSSTTTTTGSAPPSWSKSGLKLDLAKSHYQMLAGVCIEYCAIIQRTDLLFGEIFTRFQETGKADVFVELLEPYILSDKLRSLSPLVMQAFVQHYSTHNKLAQVEQCILHLNVAELDMDTMLKLCHDHELYSALIYIYNDGLDDYTTPIDVLLEACAAPRAKPKPKASPLRQTSSRVSSLASTFGGTARSTSNASLVAAKPEDDALTAERRRRLYGYKLLLYLSYSLSGRSFPQRQALAAPRVGKVRAQICHHLFEKSAVSGGSDGSMTTTVFPRLATLVELDARELFNILARFFDDPHVEFDGEKTALVTSRPTSRYDSARNATLAKCPSRLSMVLDLAAVVFGSVKADAQTTTTFSSVEHGHFFMFEARLLSGGAIDPQEYADARAQALGEAATGSSTASMMDSLLNFLALGPASLLPAGGTASNESSAHDDEGFDKAGRQAMLVRLLQKLHKDSYSHSALLTSVIHEQMHRAAVLLYKEKGDVAQVVASYLADPDHEFRMAAFSYIRTETDKLVDDDSSNTRDSSDSSSSTTSDDKPIRSRRKVIEDAVLLHAGALMATDSYAFVVLILSHFASLNKQVLHKFVTMGKPGGKLEFQYLKLMLMGSSSASASSAAASTSASASTATTRSSIVSTTSTATTTATDADDGDLGEEADVVKELLDRSKLRIADDPSVQERFVHLACEFAPSDVFPYLEAHDSYKVDACLKLCKKFNVTDAEAYLLERTGDVTGALTLILQSLETKLKILKPALRGYNAAALSSAATNATPTTTTTADASVNGLGTTTTASTQAMTAVATGRLQPTESIIESMAEGRDAMQTLEVALAMCQRNSLRNRDEQAEKLWFTLLDKLLRIQNAVKRAASSKAVTAATGRVAGAAAASSSSTTTTTRSGTSSSSGAQTAFQVALNELIRVVLERMASSVSLKSILFKITNEHGRGEFGDFRPTIFGMLDTYNYEQSIYTTANALISVDLFDQLTTLKRARAKCVAPPTMTCAYCNVVLTKPPFGMAMHHHHSGSGDDDATTSGGGEKWNLMTSLVLVMANRAFHESCGKAWQQGVVGTSVSSAVSGNSGAPAGAKPAMLRQASVLSTASASDKSLVGSTSDSASAMAASVADDETSSRLQKKQPSTRRYLHRLKNARKSMRRHVAPHVVLDSLIIEEKGRNRHLKSSRAVFSLKPDPEQAARVKKRIGKRTPGSLPIEPIQRGGI